MPNGLAQPVVTMSEAQAYVRIETGEEEAVLAALIRTASAVCEDFLNRVVIARGFTVDVPGTGCWERVPLTPIRSVTTVEAVDASGVSSPMAPSSYSIDIDSSGDGWVRAEQGAARLRVSGTVGMADSENDVPEPIRQGVLRLVAHLFTSRDGPGGDPPAAVTALWRPYRRLRLS